MDVRLAVASKRDARDLSGAEVPEEVALRILDAGRLAGSARNRQPCRFVIAEGEAVPAVADAVYRAGNVLDAGLVVAIVVTPGGNLVDFDAGRAAQNMMLAGWAEGIASCPNGIADPERLASALGIEPPERAVVVLTFGPPARPRDPARRPPERWSARAPPAAGRPGAAGRKRRVKKLNRSGRLAASGPAEAAIGHADEGLLTPRPPGPRVPSQRPVAGAPHPRRVRGRVRRPRPGRPGGVGVRLGAHGAGQPVATASRRRSGGMLAERGYAVITGGGPGIMAPSTGAPPRRAASPWAARSSSRTSSP